MRKLKQSEYAPIRQDLIDSLQRYLDHGIMPGGFLTACLDNDLCGAFARADHENTANMRNIVAYLFNDFPSDAWGSPEIVANFLKRIINQ